MKHPCRVAAGLLFLAVVVAAASPQNPTPAMPAAPVTAENRSEAYYQFAMGRYYEDLYEATARSDYATRAIEHLHKAYELDPRAAVIRERLAEMYAKTQRVRDAVLEAQEILKRDPDNLAARRLLARIYLRTLGDLAAADRQREIVSRAVEQYREILRIEPSDADAALWLARLYRIQNEPEKAAEVLRDLLGHEPHNEAALEQYTQLLLDQGKPEEAIARLQRVVESAPSPSLLGLLADAYAQTRDYRRAQQILQRAIALEPRSPKLRRALGTVLLAQQENQQALEQYLRLAELEPDEPEHHLRLAQIYRSLNQLDQAEQHLVKARERAPGSLELIYNEAQLYEAQGRYADAIRVISGAIASLQRQRHEANLQQTLAVFYTYLGRLYREVENFTAAINTFRELLPLGGDHEKRARLLIVDTYRAARELKPALDESRQALDLYPGDPSVYTSHAMLLAESGQSEQGAALLRGLLRNTAEDRDLYLSLAQVYERGRRFADAEEAARKAEQLFAEPGGKEMAWFLLAAIFERQGKVAQAEEQFKKALESNPRHAPVLNYYGYMLADRGERLDEAVELVNRALAEEPHNGAYLDSLGWAYFKQNRLVEAEEFLRRAAERVSRDPTILDHLGDLYFRTDRIELAEKHWQRALAEWQRVLPADQEPGKVAAVEQKLATLRTRLAQKPTADVKPH